MFRPLAAIHEYEVRILSLPFSVSPSGGPRVVRSTLWHRFGAHGESDPRHPASSLPRQTAAKTFPPGPSIFQHLVAAEHELGEGRSRRLALGES